MTINIFALLDDAQAAHPLGWMSLPPTGGLSVVWRLSSLKCARFFAQSVSNASDDRPW